MRIDRVLALLQIEDQAKKDFYAAIAERDIAVSRLEHAQLDYFMAKVNTNTARARLEEKTCRQQR